MLRIYDTDLPLYGRRRRAAARRKFRSGYWGSPPTPAANAGLRDGSIGKQMPDGYSSKVVFAAFPNCPFWELVPKFGGIDGGAPIKLTSMRNLLWHTAAARSLLMAEDTEVEVSFAVDLWDKVVEHLINHETTVTEFFPDGSTLCYYGWLGKLGQFSLQEGELPKTSITIHKSCRDPSDGTEHGPILTPATGT